MAKVFLRYLQLIQFSPGIVGITLLQSDFPQQYENTLTGPIP